MYCMVPGQRLTVTAPPEVVTLFTDAPTSGTRWMQERPDPVVALGRDKMNVHMTGVELRLKKLTPRPVVPNIHPEGTADIVVEAGRVCEVRTVTEGQNPQVIVEVNNLIEAYLAQSRTIILAVVPSNVDVATVDILERAQNVDPTGERTIGVLTKPDLIDRGSEAEVVQVLTNVRKPLKLG